MLSITQGDNKIVSQYTGADPTEFTLSGGSPTKWYELRVVTGVPPFPIEGETVYNQHWGGEANDPTSGWRKPDANGVAKFLFNASANDDIVKRSHDNGWIIPAGKYLFLVREFYNTEPLQQIEIEIVNGEIGVAIQTVTMNKARGKKK